MKNILTIDTGTTNTRVKIFLDDKIIAKADKKIGVRNNTNLKKNQKFKKEIDNLITKVLSKANIKKKQLDLTLGIGMLSSDIGLYEVPHVFFPAGKVEIAKGIKKKKIFDIPINFIPGVRTAIENVTLNNCEEVDMMRGEEAEVFGIVKYLKLQGPLLIILPGSHTKFIFLNDKNKISKSITTLAGELIAELTNNSILSSSLESTFAKNIEKDFLLKGAELSNKIGSNRSSFITRILEQFGSNTVNQRANYLLGTILSNDLLAVKSYQESNMHHKLPVVIGGNNLIKDAFGLLIKEDDYFKTDPIIIEDNIIKNMSSIGAIEIAKNLNL
ncbi:2-dehydro-3-deoxygalactonokinase [Halanaerobium saccharolyticum subsp. saccharolyticum DSM 6643]|uniref:2-dehydro-3-deoxygalactonokinase n=1 Tax=Halanaerobium saccharolyticum subsp. saccharolyticum DSM 6643 TaxID=1293054 RepID=M5DYN6_9FIRM|nr:2-dehydro-3-deoxygalactonokinase [Halanaerobium saccharolyticum]CCU78708.1 2-dehydro-3-deoxygalactonokinase [Halanaerobium saccharolyticum subsp. saccharolyticum DSM 6643]